MLFTMARRVYGSGSHAGSAALTAPAGGLARGVLGAAELGRRVALLATVALVAACGSEPGVQQRPPNLSGVYDLVSFSLRGGPTYSAPEATGTFVLARDYTVDVDLDEATGDMSADVVVASVDPPIEVEYQGKYFNYTDGTWKQTGLRAQAEALGTYTFGPAAEAEDTTLTISITEPTAAVSNYVWRLR